MSRPYLGRDVGFGPVPVDAPEGRAVHDLKVWPQHFAALADGRKTFEVRRDDRGFNQGDTLRLREWQPGAARYTGREVTRGVGFLIDAGALGGMGIAPGYCVMALSAARVPDCNAPRRIWLQTEGLSGYWTWADHEVDASDVEYVRADLAAQQQGGHER